MNPSNPQFHFNGDRSYFSVRGIFDHKNEIYLTRSSESCMELFKNYKFVMNGKPVVVKDIYRYITFNFDSITDHDLHGDYWESIDIIERYGINVEDYGCIELKKFQWIHLQLGYPLEHIERYSYRRYEDQIKYEVRKSNEFYIKDSRIDTIDRLYTILIDTSDDIKIYELSDN